MKPALNRREFSQVVAASAMGLSTSSLAQSQGERPPNIVLIMADDLGYNHLGSYGQEIIPTPHLDRLAAEGMRFTQFYSGSTVCAPSRCALMTGRHTGHCSVRGNSGGIPIPDEDVTVAEVLKQAGYATGVFGKWGLGDARTTGVPTKQGFDEFFGYLDQVHAHFYYPDYLWHNDEKVPLLGNEGGKRQQYSHDVITERALAFIRRHRDAPFFCYVPFTIPHTELLVPEDSLSLFKGKFQETPFPGDHYGAQEMPRAAYAAMVTRMDRDVGRISKLLEELNLAERTLFIFTSDNGGQRGGAGVDLEFFKGNWPLRGWKGLLYEGGIRVPFIARWPGRIKAGSISNQVWASWDLMPTMAELARVKPPSGLDGVSVVAALSGKEFDRDHLYWEQPSRGKLAQAARMGPWKAVRHSESEPLELYYLPTDVAEKFNLASNYPERRSEAETYLRTARTAPPPQIEPEAGESRYR